ncbi:hypothetical protein JS528_03445 [Bifidobacterium sp. MA2]|uniref:CTP synthase n=1 Tax=Bifidobacterium santillanense TaxID=2809028 RepID=A0ABS5UNE1_9BIFI|nr:hypothetical protein [Bifidobacterium santillanense]MBT1172430.1 hypothetical protein [Bifidobacterium santillanense]
MRTHKELAAMMRTAQRERRCVIGCSRSIRRACRRRLDAGELVSPYRNLYMERTYWDALNPEERSLHVIRALSKLHPRWVFAGLSAACLYGFEHAHSLHDGTVHIVCTGGITDGDHDRLRRIYMPRIPLWVNRDRCYMTSPARTLIDCAGYPFANALAIYDSALRGGRVTIEDVRTLMIQTTCDEDAVTRLLRHANPLSENGGESLMRGRIVELDFAEPLLQVEFDNPANPSMPYRVDFCWRLADGRIIVAEYDGMAKYADTSNPNRASLRSKLDYERARERDLRAQGVTAIVHVFYEDVMTPQRLGEKLTTAGVPKLR